MRVLVGCECSGKVRDAFRALGHEAYSCDLEGVEADGIWREHHLYGDVRNFVEEPPFGPWDMAIFFPPCTYLCSSGLHWNKRVEGRQQKTDEALEFVRYLLGRDEIPKIALENPKGCISTKIRRPDQYIQPYDFGDDASKETGLWLKNLALLKPTKRVPGRIVADPRNGKLVERWANQTDSGQNRLGPSEERAALRGETYEGIAMAMAWQWTFED